MLVLKTSKTGQRVIQDERLAKETGTPIITKITQESETEGQLHILGMIFDKDAVAILAFSMLHWAVSGRLPENLPSVKDANSALEQIEEILQTDAD